MPNLLRKDTRQRLEASQKALFEALNMIQRPKIKGNPVMLSSGALEIGLVGVSAELAIAACLFEVLGESGIRRSDSGFYLTASEALSRFKSLLKKAVPKTYKFKKGVSNESHFADLLKLSQKFKILFDLRATGLHAGCPVSEQVVLHAANDVAAFLVCLGKGSDWNPYLKSVPEPVAPLVSREIIISELLSSTKGTDKQSITQNVLSAFLVLPTMPKNEPDWLSAIDRVAIAPNKSDLKILLSTLADAKVGDLKKVGKGVKSLAVHIVGKDEGGIPVYPNSIKTNFTKPHDNWGAAVGTVNSGLSQLVLNLPHITQVYHFCAVGLSKIGFPDGELEAGLSAHSIWPFVAASLCYPGTEGPCFFLLRHLKKSELGQLDAILKKGGGLSPRLQKKVGEYWEVIESVVDQSPCASNNLLVLSFLNESSEREKKKEQLIDRLSFIKTDCASNEAKGIENLISIFDRDGGVYNCLEFLTKNKNEFPKSKSRLTTALVDAATDREDLLGIVPILAAKDFSSNHTNSRKAIRAIDYSLHGPSFDIV